MARLLLTTGRSRLCAQRGKGLGVRKRFWDTDIWEKKWFDDLDGREKLAMFYIFAKCDAVGVWEANTRIAEVYIGYEIDWDGLRERVNGNIEVLPNGKWFLPDFCSFQYGELKESCKPHRSYLSLLQKHGLFERVTKGYRKGINTLQEKEKETDKEKDKEQEEEIDRIIDYFNTKTGSHIQPKTESNRKYIRARLNDGYTLEDAERAIAWCNWKWKDDEKMYQYIRIPTIFGAEKFGGYVDNFRRDVDGD